MTDSSTGGYIAPTGTYPAPLEDADLDALLQSVVTGITGLAGNLVRPRWQPEAPPLPPRTVTWAAIGVPSRHNDWNPVVRHDPAAGGGQGADVLTRNEELDVLCSFYGPLSSTCATTLRDGLGIAQNREALQLAGFALVSAGEPTKAPELIQNQFLTRCDLALVLRRQLTREYPVLSIVSAPVTIDTDATT